MKKMILLFFVLLMVTFNVAHAREMFFERDGKNFMLGFQLTTDFVVSQYPDAAEEYVAGPIDEDLKDYTDFLDYGTTELLGEVLGFKNMHFVRIDFFANAELTDKTKLNYLMALRVLGDDSGMQEDFNYVILNAEIEHLYRELFRIRIGRLNEKYSESRFFGRTALGHKDAHIFGRTPFVNDALEINLDSAKSGFPLDLATGVKVYKAPLDFSTAFLISQYKKPIGNHTFKTFFIYSYNKQLEEDLSSIFPYMEHDRYYHGYEGEISFSFANAVTPYVNVGWLSNYMGYMQHTSGMRDILKKNEPLITDPDESVTQTTTTCVGLNVKPSNLSDNLKFFRELVAEFEYMGNAGDEQAEIYNSYFHANLQYKSLAFHYGLSLNMVRFPERHDLYEPMKHNVLLWTDELNNYTHFFRITTFF